MPDMVPVYLQVLNVRNRRILESRIDLEGGVEVAPLLVEPLLERILFSSCSNGFLCIIEITQESISGDKRENSYKLCDWR